jgi:hypothetical protein
LRGAADARGQIFTELGGRDDRGNQNQRNLDDSLDLALGDLLSSLNDR